MSLLNQAKQILEEAVIKPKVGHNFAFTVGDRIVVTDDNGDLSTIVIDSVSCQYDSVSHNIEPVFMTTIIKNGAKVGQVRYYGIQLGNIFKKMVK